MLALALVPELRSEVHPDLNDKAIDYDAINARSKMKIWWLGKCKHSWEATIGNRYNGTGCPICAGHKILEGFNDFQTFFPALAAEWHPVNNGLLLPTEFSKGSNKKVWWLGKACSHEWEAQISNRANGNGCPICAGKTILPGFNDLATKYPDIAKLWHPTLNGEVSPSHIAPTAAKIYWWLGKCGHEWDTSVSGMTRDGCGGCPICTAKRVLAGFNDLATLNPELAAQWNIKKNAPLLPNTVAGKSGKKVWWIGKECKHEWKATILSRHQGNGCPVCVGQQVLAGFNDLATTNPELAAEWDFAKNPLEVTPSTITTGTSRKVWWIGKECGHSWEAAIANRAVKGRGCHYCSNQKALIGFNDLATTHPEVITEWHPTKNDDLLPTMVVAGAIQSVWWKCKKSHEWKTVIRYRTQGEQTGCPECAALTFVSRAEQNIVNFLKHYDLSLEQSNRQLLCGGELDIYIPDKKVAIEYNGLYWHTEDKGKDRNYHYNKWLACKALGIQLIQIWEDEWNKNPEQIKAMLLHKLGITQQEKVFARKTLVAQLSKTEIEAFLEEHHVRGYAAGSHYLGLREKNTDELVAVLVLKKEANSTLNIIRYATSKNVIGGFTKLLKYAELTYKPERFITFSDHCVSDGGLYDNNGFTSDKELPPDYRYVVGGQRVDPNDYTLERFKTDLKLQWDDSMTKEELVELNHISRIWNAGKTRWVKANKR